MNIDPIDWAEKHSPTEKVLIHETDGKRTTRQYVRRRKRDADLLDRLDEHLRDKAERLRLGWMVNGGTLGYKTQNYLRESSAGRVSLTETQAQAWGDYKDWLKRCRRQRVNIGPVWDVWFFGDGIRRTERRYRVRNGTLIKMIGEALEV